MGDPRSSLRLMLLPDRWSWSLEIATASRKPTTIEK
jgi:hypothetical protein